MKNFRTAYIGTLFLLTACASQKPIVITSVSPELVPFGHDETVEVSYNHPSDDIELNILPGGPFVKTTLKLKQASKSLSVINNQAWVLTDKNNLLRFSFDGEKTTSKPDLSQNMLAIDSHEGEFGYVTQDKIRVENIYTNQTAEYETPKSETINKFAFDAQSICVANTSNQLVHIDRKTKRAISIKLDYQINDLTTLKGRCISLNKHHGLIAYAVQKGQLKEFDRYQSNDFSIELKSNGEQLLLADGNTGLTVLDIQDNGFFWAGSYNKLSQIDQVDGDRFDAIVSNTDNTISLINLEYEGTPRLISDIHIEEGIRDLKWSQDMAFVLSKDKLQVIDFSSRSSPSLSHLGVNLGGSRRSFIDGDIIYVADWFSGMHLYDISIPQEPRLISSLHTPGSPKGVIVRDGIAYIADDDHGLQVADVSNTLRPTIIANLPLRGLAYTMKLVDNTLYLASHFGGLHIIDVANPLRPKLLGTYDTEGKSWAVHVVGKLAYVADDDSGLLVFDVSNPAKIKLISHFTPGGHAEDVVIRDNIAFVAFFEQGLFVLDISNPKKIKQISHLNTPGNTRGIDITDDRLYLASWKAGLQIVDIGDLKKPKIVGHYDTKGSLWGLQVREPVVYGLDWWGGLKTFDASNIQRPRLMGKYQTAGTIERILGKDNFLFLAAGKRGLQAFDGTNALNPVWATGMAIDGYAVDIAIKDDIAFLGIAEGGVDLVDISNPFHLKWLRRIDQQHASKRTLIQGNILLTTDNSGKVSLYSVNKPASPQQLGQLDLKIKDVVSGEQGFYLLDEQNTIAQLIVNNLTGEIQTISIANLQGQAEFLSYEKERLFALDTKNYTLHIMDSTQSKYLGGSKLPLTGKASGMSVKDKRLYISIPRRGVMVVNLETDKPYIEMEYPTTHTIKNPVVSDEAIFLAGEPIIVSGERLPNIKISHISDKTQLHIPKNMPTGAFHIRATTNNQQIIRHNAFKLGFKKPKKSKFTLEDLKQKMQQKSFEGKAP